MSGGFRVTHWRTWLVVMAAGGFTSACDGSQGAKGSEGPAGAGCTIVENTDATKTIICGTAVVTISNGKPGDGCTIEANADGSKTVTCGNDTAVLSNGKDGKNGSDGTNGVAGTDGKPGVNALPCTVKDNGDSTKTISCPDGTSVTLADGATGTMGTDGSDGKDGTNGSPCTVKDNGNGTKTIKCGDGTVAVVTDGKNGVAGDSAFSVKVKDFHGTEHLLSSGEYLNGAKTKVTATITGATADAAGKVTVSFKLADATNKPVTSGVTSISATIVKLVPADSTAGESFNKWVPYLFAKAVTSGKATGTWPAADGTVAFQAGTENSSADPTKGGKLTDHGDGTFTYEFKNNITNLAAAVDGTSALPNGATKYERGQLHRVVVTLGGHAGPTADATFDFVPDGTPATQSRAIVTTSTCKQCHGEEFHGHGGNRLQTETCQACHLPGNIDPESGNALDFKVMVHKIHAGGELASVPGLDGLVWDDPITIANEAADNGKYNIWGFNKTRFDWSKVGFPAELSNCTKCHQGTGAQVDNWKKVPSRAACGSCHDNVDFATGANHKGGKQLTDNACSACHSDQGTPLSIVDAHDWTAKDKRNIAEFTVDFTVSTPTNGKYFVAGESPVLTLVAKEDGVPIDHTTLAQDVTPEGCLADACPPRDGLFINASLYVHGPRAQQMPVLTTNARAAVISASAGPWNLSATGTTLVVSLDAGISLWSQDASGGDVTLPGVITVAVPTTGTFADKSAATAGEMVKWLNGDAKFAARAVAYLDAATGKLAIRSRNLGKLYSVQLQPSAVTTAVFGGDVTVHTVNFSTVANKFYHTVDSKTGLPTPSKDDPKVTWSKDKITYTLDPVDDLRPGTYGANIELADRGTVSPAAAPVGQPAALTTNYKTPTVARVQFQVGQAAVEKPIANNCGSCHMGPDGKGFVLDFQRHNKLFDNDAPSNLCGACHDQQPQGATGDWSGAKAISKRVHAIHLGSKLNYPNATVGHADTTPGRNWDITLPQDARNCEVCHNPATTSGTWATTPGRLACSGCHDSNAASAHIKLQTVDPTPADPYSGDEVESCKTCH
jgi:OmcA/MtrC family decaheme c-type cytochrome